MAVAVLPNLLRCEQAALFSLAACCHAFLLRHILCPQVYTSALKSLLLSVCLHH